MRRTRRHVVRLDAAAERVDQQLLGHRADEHLRAGQDRLAQRHDAVDRRAVRQLPGGVDRAARLRACATRRRRRSSRARSRSDPSPCGSSRTTGLARCSPSARAASSASALPRSPSAAARPAAAAAPAGRADVLEHPLAAQHRRRALGVRRHRQDAAVAQQPAARLVGDRHAAEVAAVDVGDAVVARQPLVDERVVGASADRARCGPRARCCRTAARSRAGTPAAGCRRSPGTRRSSAARSRTLRSCSHWPAKLVTSALDSRIGQHPPDLLRRAPPAPVSRPCAGDVAAAPRPGCCSTGRTTAATPARRR